MVAFSGQVDKDLQSVLDALDVLECLVREEDIDAGDLAQRLEVPECTVQRLLAAICARGLAAQDPATGRYRLGVHLFELSQMASERFPLRRAGLPLLNQLRQASHLSVHLAVPDGADIVFLERVPDVPRVGMMRDAPRRMPAHATSAGKAIAAFDPAFAQARKAAGFPQLTPRTISTAAEFDRALDQVRRTGVAISARESEGQLTSVAAPVRNFCGRAYAAIALVGTDEEFGDIGCAARLVIDATARLSQALGR